MVDEFIFRGQISHSKTKWNQEGSDFQNHYGAGVGYFLCDDLLVEIFTPISDDGDTHFSFSSSFNHQLNRSNYIGFRIHTTENFDWVGVHSKYFLKLQNETYMALTTGFSFSEDSDDFNGGISYYFLPKISITANLSEGGNYCLGIKHFINRSWGVSVGYLQPNPESAEYSVKIMGRFKPITITVSINNTQIDYPVTLCQQHAAKL